MALVSERRTFLRLLLSWILLAVSGCRSLRDKFSGSDSANPTPSTTDRSRTTREDEPTWESLAEHDVPAWYEDAKLGIFVHWYPAAVPAFGNGWYAYFMHVGKSEVNDFHEGNYGDPLDFEYKDFIRETDRVGRQENFSASDWRPERWASFFSKVGARYVVATAEHHDGFPMWDASYTEWTAVNYGPQTDVIGRLAESVRQQGMRFAGSHHRMTCHYDPRYTGLWGNPEFSADGPTSVFVDEWQSTVRNMIEHHEPDILWLDGDWSAPASVWQTQELVAWYYEKAQTEWDKEVLVNDRLGKVRFEHGDVYTPEFERFDYVVTHKWETTRALGRAWTYDRTETAEDLLTGEKLVHLFCDIVSKNGNLLINVGPTAEGRIPPIQRTPLEALGRWLDRYGEAVYGTTYWVTSENDRSDVPVRYTLGDGYLYAVLFEWPGATLRLDVGRFVDLDPASHTVELLGDGGGSPTALSWEAHGNRLKIQTAGHRPGDHHAYVVRVQLPDSVDRDKIALPDLVFTSSELAVERRDDGTVRLEVAIENRGVARSAPTAVQFFEKTDEGQRPIGRRRRLPSLANNESATVATEWDGFERPYEAATVLTVIDPDEEQRELSRATNRREFTFRLSQRQSPD